jgi:hypothetical protein
VDLAFDLPDIVFEALRYPFHRMETTHQFIAVAGLANGSSKAFNSPLNTPTPIIRSVAIPLRMILLS